MLDSVFAEVARLFPSPYIHIGGDECYKGFWEKCSKCKMRMQKEHLKNLEELQSYFVKRVAAMVQKRGKQVIGWDEILEGGLAPEAIVMSWRGMKGGYRSCQARTSVIMTPTRPLLSGLLSGRSDSRTKHLFHAAPTGLLQISTHSR